MATARFRFYEELNDFLPPDRRKREFTSALAADATVKHAIEALGVPHTEVELILADGHSVDFDHRISDGERIAVYPRFEALDITPLLRVREQPLRTPRFAADAHLGGLARLLRLAGFDTYYRNHIGDAELVALARAEERIVLSRDRELLKRRAVSHGCYIHALAPAAQLRELVTRLDLHRTMHPFSRCLECNQPLRTVARDEVLDRLPAAVRNGQEHFTTCDACRRVYWQGSHWRHMAAILEQLAPGEPAPFEKFDTPDSEA